MEERKVRQVPTLLEFYSYVLFGPGLVTGPFFEYSDYLNFISFKGHYSKLPRGFPGGLVTVLPALKQLLLSLIYVVAHLFFKPKFDANFCGEKEFITYKTFFHRIMYSTIAIFVEKCLYYHVWNLNDINFIASGFAFNEIKPTET